MSTAEVFLSDDRRKYLAIIASKKADHFKNVDCWYIEVAVLKKCLISDDCDHDHSPHKNDIFLSLYKIMIMITVLFMRTANMIAVPTKISYFLVFIGLRP